MRRIGLFGGSFDPPHLGHLTVAQDVKRALNLDEVWLIPAAIPPHKPAHLVSPAQVRLDMLKGLVAGEIGLRVSEVEILRSGVSYSVDTLRALTKAHPDESFFLVMGVDQFAELSTWKEPQEIGRLATVVVMARAGVEPPSVDPGTGVKAVSVEVTRIDISSTEVRARVERGQDVGNLVGERVARMIEDHNLYGGSRD